MDVTKKIIPVFFILILLANYFNFIGFNYILKNLPCMHGRILRKRTRMYFFSMHCLYVIVACMAAWPTFYPICRIDKPYPLVMNLASCLFIVNWIFHLVINRNKDYFLMILTVPQPAEEAIDLTSNDYTKKQA